MAVNEWGALKFDIPPIPPPDLINDINQVLSFLIEVLDIAVDAMNIAKSFLVGFLDPIAALLQALVIEIQSMIHDFNQTGIYITGDWGLKLTQLQGGYPRYQERMVSRLTDRTDHNRPDITPVTPTLGLFIYLTDEGSLGTVIQFLKNLAAFFGQKPRINSEYPIPTITQVLYGNAAAGISTFQNFGSAFSTASTPPQDFLVTWRVTPPIQNRTLTAQPTPAPSGFLVYVSTIPTGINVVYDRPRANTDKVPASSNPSVNVQPREYGSVLDPSGKPLILYGGDNMLAQIPTQLQYNTGISNGTLKDGTTRIYGMIPSDKTIIPLEQLAEDGTYYYQNVFYIPADPIHAWTTQEFSARLTIDEMPHAAHVTQKADGTLEIVDDGPPSTVFIRVVSVGDTIQSEPLSNGLSTTSFEYVFQPTTSALTGPPLTASEQNGTSAQISKPSNPKSVIFPNVNTSNYMQALKSALTVLVLSRPDLIPVDTLEDSDGISDQELLNIKSNTQLVNHVTLQRSGMEPFIKLANRLYDDKYRSRIEIHTDNSPITFRADLLTRINQLAQSIYETSGTMPNAEAYVVQNTVQLRTATWAQIIASANGDGSFTSNSSTATTILGSLSDTNVTSGLARNPYCIGIDGDTILNDLHQTTITMNRAPMQQVPIFPTEAGWLTPMAVSAAAGPDFQLQLAPALRSVIYEKFVQPDNSILVPEKYRENLTIVTNRSGVNGSADSSPAFILNGDELSNATVSFTGGQSSSNPGGMILYCLGLFYTGSLGQQILQQAALTLGVAVAAIKRPENQGNWIALRLFDIYPSWEQVLQVITSWVSSLQATTQSIVDQLVKAINSLEAKAVELQQLIQRIEAIIQTLAGFTFLLPECFGMVTISNGTQGLITDLISSADQPQDNPLSFGGGLLVVIPIPLGNIVLDILQAVLQPIPGTSPTPGVTLGTLPPLAGIGGTVVVTPPPAQPDVL